MPLSRLLWTAQRACTVSNSFIPAAVNWYEDLYGSEYADSVRELLTPDRTRAEVDAIVAATGAAPGMRFLDMGCGSGRHLIELGRRGYSGVGIDLNAAYTSEARAAADGLPMAFRVADMRKPVDGRFDVILCVFNSLGFFKDDETVRMLAMWAGNLGPGGAVVLELWNRDRILDGFRREHTWTGLQGQMKIAETRAFDPVSGRLSVQYRYEYQSGRRTQAYGDFRLFAASELRMMLEGAGLPNLRFAGSWQLEQYRTASPRMIVVARPEQSS